MNRPDRKMKRGVKKGAKRGPYKKKNKEESIVAEEVSTKAPPKKKHKGGVQKGDKRGPYNKGPNGRKTHAQHQSDYNRKQSGLDISIPKIKNSSRRETCKYNLLLFAETYFSHLLYIDFAEMHLEIIKGFEQCILYGSKSAIVCPRGIGKTTIGQIAIQWALVYGHRKYIVYACATQKMSNKRIAMMKGFFEHGVGDSLLLDDFPEIAAPIQALEGSAQRARNLKVEGINASLKWTNSELIYPTVDGSISSGSIVVGVGLTTAIRGMLANNAVRPDFVVIDDPMQDSSASSKAVIDDRKNTIDKGLSELVGQGKNMGQILLGTIIEENDISDIYTNRKLNPSWNGMRYKFMQEMPKTTPEMWKKYMEKRNEREDDDLFARAAHNYYIENRKEMDKGHVCNLPDAYKGRHILDRGEECNVLPDGSEMEVSAIQRVYNMICDTSFEAFLSELQNTPTSKYEQNTVPITLELVMSKKNNVDRWIVPHDQDLLVTYLDCGTTTDIHYAVCSFGTDFSSSVIDWGVFPVDETLPDDVALSAALKTATNTILTRPYFGEKDKNKKDIKTCFVDSGYMAKTVYDFCNRNDYRLTTHPTKGEGSDHFSIPRRRAKKVMFGDGWWHGLAKESNQYIYHIHTNYWKAFVDNRLKVGMGGASGMTFNNPGEKISNAELYESMTSEYPTLTNYKNRDEKYLAYKLKIKRNDNHIYDCVVGCQVAASTNGISMEQKKIIMGTAQRRPGRNVSISRQGGGVRRSY